MDLVLKNLRKNWKTICEMSNKLKDRLEDRNMCYKLVSNLCRGLSVGAGPEKLPSISVPAEIVNKKYDEIMKPPEYVELKNKYLQLYGAHWGADGRDGELEKIQHDAWKQLFWKWYNERKDVIRGDISFTTPEQLEGEAIQWAKHLKRLQIKKLAADAHGPSYGDHAKKKQRIAKLQAFKSSPLDPKLIEWCKQKLIDRYKSNIQNISQSNDEYPV